MEDELSAAECEAQDGSNGCSASCNRAQLNLATAMNLGAREGVACGGSRNVAANDLIVLI